MSKATCPKCGHDFDPYWEHFLQFTDKVLGFDFLGSFYVNSGSLIISDPCYGYPGSGRQAYLENVRRGEWSTLVRKMEFDGWGMRVTSIEAFFGENAHVLERDWDPWEESVDVDGGNAGIFDTQVFRNDFAGVSHDLDTKFTPGELWYDMCLSVTNSFRCAGVIPGGVVSRSGFGDGSYQCYIGREVGEVVRVRLVFITDEEIELEMKERRKEKVKRKEREE